jgi:DNA-binding NtrC family response regulator
MLELDRIVRAVAPKDVGITLIGESGVGKEVIARRVHELSHRRSGPFLPINCAAIPESLFESELFGHERGAFTGASERVRGKVEASAEGTLFLDEIGEMQLNVKAKLLRFLENRKFMRVGGSTKISIDTRLVCATLRPLEHEIQAGRFRADLFYRIQGVSLVVPPLRERRADIAPLLYQFIVELSAKHSVRPPKVSRAALAVLAGYEWPGNVRELRNVIELLCLLHPGRRVYPSHLPAALQRQPPVSAEPSDAVAPPRKLEVSVDETLDQVLQRVLHAALEVENGNRSQAARRLGISLRTVQRHLARAPRTP